MTLYYSIDIFFLSALQFLESLPYKNDATPVLISSPSVDDLLERLQKQFMTCL